VNGSVLLDTNVFTGNEDIQKVSATDPIVTISGYTGTWLGESVVAQVQFETKNGVIFGPYGSMNGVTSKTPFSATAPAGQSIVAFSGATVVPSEVADGASAVIALLEPIFGISPY
jgi:hypothetical protein